MKSIWKPWGWKRLLTQELRFLDPHETCRLRVGKRRDSHEIVAEILDSARGGATKMQIMARAKLNYSQTEEYLSLLIKKGFLVNLVVADRRQSTLFSRLLIWEENSWKVYGQ